MPEPKVEANAVEEKKLECPFSRARSLDAHLPNGTPVSPTTTTTTIGAGGGGAADGTIQPAAQQQHSPTSRHRHTRTHIPPPSVLSSLPTVFRTNKSPDDKRRCEGRYIPVAADIPAFLSHDLSVARLNAIHSHLWAAGRPLSARPLHRQKMLDRRVLYTEQADLHLLVADDRLYLKPLPLYLLSWDFWTEYLCDDRELHKEACGFLMSYVWLVVSELDFKLARDDTSDTEHLLPLHPALTWTWWKDFVVEFVAHVDVNALDMVNKRYHFGELRLGRINTIYRTSPRFFTTHFVRGYLYGYNRYVVYFQRNFAWILVVFVWFSLVLSAMQVGIGVPPLSESTAFKNASYGFVVFSIVLVLFILFFISVMFLWIFVYNMIAAIRHASTETNRRKKWANERKGEKNA